MCGSSATASSAGTRREGARVRARAARAARRRGRRRGDARRAPASAGDALVARALVARARPPARRAAASDCGSARLRARVEFTPGDARESGLWPRDALRVHVDADAEVALGDDADLHGALAPEAGGASNAADADAPRARTSAGRGPDDGESAEEGDRVATSEEGAQDRQVRARLLLCEALASVPLVVGKRSLLVFEREDEEVGAGAT